MFFVTLQSDFNVNTHMQHAKRICLIVLLLLLICAGVLVSADFLRNRRLQKRASMIETKVEQYLLLHEELPKSLDDLPGLSEESEEKHGADAVLYYKGNDSVYVIYYCKSFDENWYYYSDTRQWTTLLRFAP